MTWTVKYTSQFKALRNEIKTYRVDILEKDYAGSPIEIILGQDPVIQEWQDDGYKIPIRGCTLTVNIISNDGQVSITDFYSEEDDKYRIDLTDLSNDYLLFTGYVVQDDCQEIQVDFNHILQLSATDNLGLLKEITLDQAALKFGNIATYNLSVEADPFFTTHIISSTNHEFGFLKPGYQFKIYSGALAGTYTVQSITLTEITPIPYLGRFDITVLESVPPSTIYSSNVDFYLPDDLLTYRSLCEIFRLCLKSTNLDLAANVYSELYPINGENSRWIDDVWIEPNTFLTNSEWASCYDVLERILDRFSATLFQANGVWNIVRWGEFYRYSTVDGANLQGYSYNSDFQYILDINSEINFDFHTLEDLETGLIKTIYRPIKISKEIYNFNNNYAIVKNGDLNILGTFIREYTAGQNRYIQRFTIPGSEGFKITGDTIDFQRDQTFIIQGTGTADGTYTCLTSYNDASGYFIVLVAGVVPLFTATNADIIYQTFSEYEAPYWYDSQYTPPNIPRYIRVVTDFQDNEIDRYIVLDGSLGAANLYGAKSNDIAINQGDVIKVYFDFRTIESYTVPSPFFQIDFALSLTNDNIYKNFISSELVWVDDATFSYTYTIQAGDNTNKWHTAEAISVGAPFSGIFNVYLRSDTDLTLIYKNIRVVIENGISQSKNLTGQIHTRTQTPSIKNIEEKEIYLDDSYRAYLAGAMFTKNYVGLARQMTKKWNYLGAGLSYRLGELTTLENLFQHYYPKDIYNGNHLKIYNNDGWHISPLAVFKDAQDAELKRYVPGSLSLNYKEGTCDFTIYEVDNSDIIIGAFQSVYEFNYLYENK